MSMTTLGLAATVAALMADPCSSRFVTVDLEAPDPSGNLNDRRVACDNVRLQGATDTTSIVVYPESTNIGDADEHRCTLAPDASGGATLPKRGQDKACDALVRSAAAWRVQTNKGWTRVGWHDPPSTSEYVVTEGKAPPPLPPEVAPDRPYLHKTASDVRWTTGPKADLKAADGRAYPDGGLAAMLENFAKHDTGLELLVEVPDGRGAYQRVPLKLVRKAKDDSADTTTQPSRPAGPDDLLDACEKASGFAWPEDADLAPNKTGRAARKARRRRRKSAAVRDKTWSYALCVDATDPRHPKSLAVTSRRGADPAATRGGRHLYSGRPVTIIAFTQPNTTVTIDLDGEAGVLDTVARLPDAEGSRGLVEGTDDSNSGYEVVSKPYAGRSTKQDFVTLKISQTRKVPSSTGGDPKDEPLPDVEIPIRVEDAFTGAFRLAASASWAPWDRTWTTRARSGGTNPGREIVIDDGAGQGLAYFEFVAGYSAFWFPVFEDERTVSLASFVGLGVVSGSSGQDLDIISSIHFAPIELVVGRYFGIAPDISLRRTERLRDGFDVNTPVADGDDITRFGITPAFGIVLNFGPEFARTIGLAQKGFNQ